MLRFRFFLVLLVAFFFSLSGGLWGQTEESTQKIGLVLSGGGAKGVAHIGVLKALENAGIRPDYIVGTSMGSIIGSLYALGYSADQLDSITRGIDWDLVLTNNIPLTYISYEEKEYYNRYLIELPIVNKKLTLPTGLIEGQMLTDLLSHLTLPAMKYSSFGDFPIPFRCVATDVSTGKAIIFEDGSLSEAIRASMAIPTVFTSADLDSTLAVDGGIVNNFPVEELIKMSADIIIGVDVGDGFVDAKELGSMTGILMQVSMISSLERLEQQRKLCDIYVHPELDGFSAGSFSSTSTILERGYQAGEKHQHQFDSLAKEMGITPKKYEGIGNHSDWITIREIEVKGEINVTDKLVKSKLGIHRGDIVNGKMIEEGIKRIYGLNSFKKVSYSLQMVSGYPDEMKLLIKVMEQPPAMLKASVHYDNTFSAGVVFNFTLRNLVGRESRALVIADIAENPKFRFDYLKYFGIRQKWALQFKYDFLRLGFPVYENGKEVDIQSSTINDFYVNTLTTNSLNHSFSAGINFNFNRSKSNFSQLLPSEFNYVQTNNINLVAGFITNSFNHRNFPVRGQESLLYVRFYPVSDYKMKLNNGVDTVYLEGIPLTQEVIDLIVTELLEPPAYGTFYFRHVSFHPLAPNFQLISRLMFGGVISTAIETASFQDFNLGGNQMVNLFDSRMYGLNYAEIVSPNFLMAGIGFQNVLFKNLYFQYGADVLGYYQYVPIDQLSLFNGDDFFSNNILLGYGFQARYKSPLGPISLGLSGNTRDPYMRVYFQIGFSFNYFD